MAKRYPITIMQDGLYSWAANDLGREITYRGERYRLSTGGVLSRVCPRVTPSLRTRNPATKKPTSDVFLVLPPRHHNLPPQRNQPSPRSLLLLHPCQHLRPNIVDEPLHLPVHLLHALPHL